MARLVLAPSVAAALACSVVGCIVVSGIGRFSEGLAPADAAPPDVADEPAVAEGGVDDPTQPSTLRFTMRDMGVHFNQLIEFRIIDNTNTIQTRGLLFPLDDEGTVSVTVNVPYAVTIDNRPFRLDFYGDMNHSGTYDGIGDVLKQDHAWRVAPLQDSPANAFPHVPNLVQVVFEHTKLMTDIDQWPIGTQNPAKATGLSALVRFAGEKMGTYVGKLVEVRIAESRTLRTVGFFRQPKLATGDLAVVIDGVLEPDVSYNVDVYIDANGNGAYDNPSKQQTVVDLGFRIPVKAQMPDPGDASPDAGASTPLGIVLDFDPQGAYPNNVDVGEP
jgi:hypothetical protein